MRTRFEPSNDGPKAVLAATLLIFVAAASLSDGGLLPDFSAAADRPQPLHHPAGQLTTGSILITPAQGNICEHRLIDNATWQIRPAGHALCDEAVVGISKQIAGGSQSRFEAIRNAFQKR